MTHSPWVDCLFYYDLPDKSKRTYNQHRRGENDCCPRCGGRVFQVHSVWIYFLYCIDSNLKNKPNKKRQIRTLLLFIPGRESLVGEGRVPQVILNIIHFLRRVFHSQSDPTFGPICHKVGSRIWAYPNKHAFKWGWKNLSQFWVWKGLYTFHPVK